MSPTLRFCSLYPELMNIYADRGNILMLQRRCEWRGIGFEVTNVGLGEQLDPDSHELFYLGGGQDRDQLLCAEDLVQVKGEAMRAAANRGALLLGVCGGYQLFGRSYELSPGTQIEGLGLLGVETVRHDGARLIGNIAIETDLEGAASGGQSDHRPASSARDPTEACAPAASALERQNGGEVAPVGTPRVLAGFENHGGMTRLLPGQAPLGRVLKGFGNDGGSGFEGARSGSVIGTYLHGPLLPKNAWFADWLIAAALGIDPVELSPLHDALERQAHRSALRAAGV